MYTRQHVFVVLLLVMSAKSKASMAVDFDDIIENNKTCSSVITVGCVIECTNRLGKEQRIAIEMAVQDHIIYTSSSSPSNCDRLRLVIEDSEGSPFGAIASAIDLFRSKQVEAIIVTTLEQELTYHNAKGKLPFISLNSPAIPSPTPPFHVQMANDVVFQAQCLAALVDHFNWRKVTAIYEHNFNGFSAITLTHLSDSLRSVNSEIKHHNAFPSLSSLSHPEKAVEKELQKLKSLYNRVFVVFRFSLPSVLMLFKKAKQMGMMEQGYVWIISDEIASLLDSIESSFMRENMQGVIGIKTSYEDSSKAIKIFKRRFRRIYESQYPEEEENSGPSIFALRAYDSITAIAKAVEASPKRLSKSLSSINFTGLSGPIEFKNGMLAQSPTFEIINVDGKSYREIAFWSKEHGFSNNFVNDHSKRGPNKIRFDGMGSVRWPGGTVRTVAPSRSLLEETERPLRLVIPASGLHREFVTFSHNQVENKTSVTGFSIDVFQAAVKRLPQVSYEFVPFNDTYDEMVNQVYKKAYDGAVGDIQINANRCRYMEFTQPYINSGLDMIVTVESDQAKQQWLFKGVFSKNMWILLVVMHFFNCCVVYLVEYVYKINHPNLAEDEVRDKGVILFFSILTFSQKNTLRCHLARFIFAPWMLVILVLMATFTASLSSMLTVSQIKPSILDVETLQRINATVGCNRHSFTCKYLVDTLNFRQDKIRNFTALDQYSPAFQKGEIKAAFFTSPHAMVFLARNCGFTRSATWKLGGYGFAFPKGSPLAIDMSEAVIEITESKEVGKLEMAMLSSLNNCSSSTNLGTGPIDVQPFSILLTIAGAISVIAFLVALVFLALTPRPSKILHNIPIIIE